MVKFFTIISVFLLTLLYSDTYSQVRLIIGDESYERYSPFIHKIFGKNSVYSGKKLDINKITKILQDNGLIKGVFKEPRLVKVKFIITGSKIFALNVLSKALFDLSYYNYDIKRIDNKRGYSTIDIEYKSEYSMDVVLLNNTLKKLKAKLVSYKRYRNDTWTYYIDLSKVIFTKDKITLGTNKTVKILFKPYLARVNSINKIVITNRGKRWYPQVTFLSKNFSIVKVYSSAINKKVYSLTIPKRAYYILIGDKFRLSNLKRGLVVVGK